MVADPRLVIVRRWHFATYELLTRTFADDRGVQFVWDRRVGERRRAEQGSGNGERRRTDRRGVPPGQWGQLNYMIDGSGGFGGASAQRVRKMRRALNALPLLQRVADLGQDVHHLEPDTRIHSVLAVRALRVDNGDRLVGVGFVYANQAPTG